MLILLCKMYSLYNYRKRHGGKIKIMIMIMFYNIQQQHILIPDDLTKKCGCEYQIFPSTVAYDPYKTVLQMRGDFVSEDPAPKICSTIVFTPIFI